MRMFHVSYCLHTGRPSSRRHTRMSRRPADRRHSGHFYIYSLQRKHTVRTEEQDLLIIDYWTHPDRSGLRISRSGRSRRPFHWSVCYIDRVPSRLFHPNKLRYRSRVDPSARDTTRSGARRTHRNIWAPGNRPVTSWGCSACVCI